MAVLAVCRFADKAAPPELLHPQRVPLRLDAKNAEAWRFEQLTEDTIRFVDEIERVTGARVSLIATGFMPHRGVIDRRQW